MLKKIQLTLLLIFLSNFTNIVYSQNSGKLGYIKFRDSKQKITDLSEEASKKCSQSLIKKVGENFVEVKFQPEFAEAAEIVFDDLEKSVLKTQKILSPLKIDNIRYYLLQLDKLPANFSLYEEKPKEAAYIHLEIFKDRKDLVKERRLNEESRLTIFSTIPHELTHSALDELINRQNTRWFDEGLADYVGNQVKEFLSGSETTKKIENHISIISLNRNDIRENIFDWKEADFSVFKMNQSQMRNQFYYYVASYQLIKEILAEAEKKVIEKPLEVLLTKLEQSREKFSKPAGTPEIISLIEQHLKVNPKTLGVLDEQTQKNLVNEALDILSRKEISPEKQYYALYVLAGINEVYLSDQWLTYLLDEIYRRKKEESLTGNLAATALAQRFNQDNFEAALKNYLNENKELKSKSAKKIKQELQELAIRPKIR